LTVPGDRIVLVGGGASPVASFVDALRALPGEPRWVVVGGFAVYLRIGRVHRVTADIDTVTRDSLRLVELLVAAGATHLSAARLTLPEPTAVQLDVMSDTNDEPLPEQPSDRAFALARRYAANTASEVSIVVVSPGKPGIELASAVALVATVPALITMKAVSMPRRSASPHPGKVGSDIHDLVRLVSRRSVLDLVASIRQAPPELVTFVGETLAKWFSTEHDLRYTLARLRRFVTTDDARSVAEEDLAVVGELGRRLLHE
jgi:hypothetical protein